MKSDGTRPRPRTVAPKKMIAATIRTIDLHGIVPIDSPSPATNPLATTMMPSRTRMPPSTSGK